MYLPVERVYGAAHDVDLVKHYRLRELSKPVELVVFDPHNPVLVSLKRPLAWLNGDRRGRMGAERGM